MGQLTEPIEAIEEKTFQEAMSYYRIGGIYLYKKDHREYVLIHQDDELAHFQSFDGHNLFIPVKSLGTFLPDVASEDMELIFVE